MAINAHFDRMAHVTVISVTWYLWQLPFCVTKVCRAMARRPQAHALACGSSLTIIVLAADTALIAASPIVSMTVARQQFWTALI
jgi:hypothetical protein